MSYEEGLRVGGFMSSLGNTFSGIMKDNQQMAIKAEDREKEKLTDVDAAKALKDPNYISQIPEDRQLSVMAKVAKAKADEYKTSREGIELEGQRRSENYAKIKEANQIAQVMYEKGDYQSAAYKLAEGYGYLNDHWSAQVEQGDEQTGAPGQVVLKHQMTGETRKLPITKEGVAEGLSYVGKFSNDPKEYNALEERNKAFVQQYNIEAAEKAEDVYDGQGQRVGKLLRMINKDQKGNYDLDRGPQTFLFSKGQLQHVEQLPEGWTTKKQAGEQSDIEVSQYKAKQANALGGALGTPDYKEAFQAQGGQTMAPLIGGGYGQVNPSMAPKQKPHMMGTVTDDEGNVQAIAQEDPYSTKVSKVETGIKSPSKTKKVRMIDPNTGEQVMISKDEEAGMRQTLKMAQELLKTTKDEKGNPLLLLDPEDVNPKDADAYVDKLNRLIDDPKASEGVKHAAQTAKFHYQAFGVMPLDRKGAIGGKEKASASGNKKASWKEYAPLN